MTTAYTSLLGLALPVTGELSGTWGDTVNNSITSLLDSAVAGTTNVSTDGDVTLTTTTGAANQAREAILLFSGARTAQRTVTAPAQSKVYTVINATTGGYAVKLVGAGPTTGLTIPNGASAIVAWNGSDFVEIGTSSIGNLTVNGTLTVTGNITAGTTSSGANVVAYSSSYGSNGLLRVFGTDGNNKGAFGASSATTVTLNARTGVSMIFEANDAEQMRLTSTGLGIGTSTPNYGGWTKAVSLVLASGSAGFEAGTATTTADAVIGAMDFIQTSNSSAKEVAQIVARNTGSTSGNTGAYLSFWTKPDAGAVAERMRLDSSGNLGLGVTPSAWTNYKAINIQNNGAFITSSANSELRLGANSYYNAGWKYANSSIAVANYQMDSGNHYWYTAPSGTAGNAITFTQAMTLDASGNLVLGATSALGAFEIVRNSSSGSGVNYPNIRLDNQSATGYTGIYFLNSGTNKAFFEVKNDVGALTMGTSSTERARIDSSGNFGIGNTSPSSLLTVGSGSGPVATPTAIQMDNTYYGSSAYDKLKFYMYKSGAESYGFGLGGSSDLQYWAGNNSSGMHAWYTSQTERMRLDSSGNLLVGTTSYQNSKFSSDGGSGTAIWGKCSTASSATSVVWNSATSGDNQLVYLYTDTAPYLRGSIVYNRAGGIVVYSTTSDYRAKDIYGPVTDSGVLIDSTPVYMGKMKGATQERPMFIAHETPDYAHTGVKDAVDEDGNPIYQQMDASALIPVMWAEIQSLRKRLATLESK